MAGTPGIMAIGTCAPSRLVLPGLLRLCCLEKVNVGLAHWSRFMVEYDKASKSLELNLVYYTSLIKCRANNYFLITESTLHVWRS